MSAFEFTVPILIVGGGACGAVAALAAADEGVLPLLIERDIQPMGSTGMSQGLICGAGTKAQAAHGIEDNGDIFFADIMAKTRGQADPVIAAAIAHSSGPTLDWLIETHDLPWTLDTAFRAAYGNSTLRVHGWPGHGGMDMVSLLHQRMADRGIDVLTGAQLSAVIANDSGQVQGVEITRPDGAIERIGCETLIFASGGFAANHAMVARHMPEIASARNHGHEGSQGDAVRFGTQLGAALGDMGSYQGYAMLTEPHGITVPPGIILEGGFIVNVAGRRFVDESADISGMVHPVIEQSGDHVWVIFDASIESRCAHIPETASLMKLGAARSADSITELAGQIGITAKTLNATLHEIETAKIGGKADRFGRLWSGVPCPASPFRAYKVIGAIYHTQGGLQIDGAARVLRSDGTPSPNMFAGGGAARGVSGPSCWGYIPAMGLCAAVTLGRIAGQSAARQVAAISASKLR